MGKREDAIFGYASSLVVFHLASFLSLLLQIKLIQSTMHNTIVDRLELYRSGKNCDTILEEVEIQDN